MLWRSKPVKLGSLQGEQWKHHRHDSVYEIQPTSGPSRLVMTIRKDPVGLVRSLVERMEPPFGVLYVLTVSRTGHPRGRYQNTHSWSRAELDGFLSRFADALACDGRHSIWIASTQLDGSYESQVIYDQHDFVYAYGDLERFTSLAQARGLRSGRPAIPCPHEHRYHAKFDLAEQQILTEYEWTRHDLVEEIDDP